MKILLVENHAVFASQVISAFLSAHEVTVVPTISAARSIVVAGQFDAALIDYDLDDGKGDELVRWLRTQVRSLRIIAISSHDEGNRAMVRAGAADVCGKMEFSRIGAVLDESPKSGRE